MEGLQISSQQGSFRVAVAGVRMTRLNFSVTGAIFLKRPFQNRSNVLQFLGQASFVIMFSLKEVSQKSKSFVLELQSFIFEGSLAEKFRFLSFKASFLKEVCQKSFVFEL